MEIVVAVQLIDETLVARGQKPLCEPEKTIVQGTWQKLTYEQMAASSSYSMNYLMRDIGPQFWKRLSEAFAEKVSKTNFIAVLEHKFSLLGQTSEQNPVPDKSMDNYILNSSLSAFYGREPQLNLLQQWLLKDKCQLVVLRGLGGMGKTALARKLVQEVEQNFATVIWRSLAHAPSLDRLLKSLLGKDSVASTTQEMLSQLMSKMYSERWLLVLDGLESILQAGELAGSYQKGYENYGDLWQRWALETHQSCLLITGREIPSQLNSYVRETLSVCSLTLGSLSAQTADLILSEEGLEASPSWQTLNQHYQGNPAALKIAAQMIKELFNGNGAEFLAQGTLVFGEIAQLMASSFVRLSAQEREILYWLASTGKPLSFAEIQTGMPASLYQTELLEALISLEQRLLIETTIVAGKSLFSLPTMVMEYVTNQLYQELKENNPAGEPREGSISLGTASKQLTHLSAWLEDNLSVPWQPLSSLLGANSEQQSPRLRGAFYLRGKDVVKRFKKIKLTQQSNSPSVALVLALTAESDGKIGIRVQIHPQEDEPFLPAHLKLLLLNNAGDVLKEIYSQQQDNFMQLPRITGSFGETFQLQIVCGDTTITEEFVI